MPPSILNSVLRYVTAPTTASSSAIMSGAPTHSSASKSGNIGSRSTPFSSSGHTTVCGSGSAYTPRLTPGHRQQQAAAETFKSDVKRMLYLQGNLSALADVEVQDQDQDQDQEQEQQQGGMSSPTVALSSALLKRVSISGQPPPSSTPSPRSRWGDYRSSSSATVNSQRFSDDCLRDHDGRGNHEKERDEETDHVVVEEEEDNLPWWQRKWGKDLAAEAETEWVVNSHCKRRTQMYHSLLHYKLRLLLKIRERVRQKALRSGPLSPVASPRVNGRGGNGGRDMHGGSECESSADESVSDSDRDNDIARGARVSVSVSAVLGGGFVAVEVKRFEDLLAVAGQQFGGEEHSKVYYGCDVFCCAIVCRVVRYNTILLYLWNNVMCCAVLYIAGDW